MRTFPIIIFITVLSISTPCAAQEQEFQKENDSLIYSAQTVTRLRSIVDSLNIKFRSCSITKIFLGLRQGKADYISMEKGDLRAAMKDMQQGMTADSFIMKYAPISADRDLLVVCRSYKNDAGKDIFSVNSNIMAEKYEHEVEANENPGSGDLDGKWVFRYYSKTKYSTASLAAFYFSKAPTRQPLAPKYASMVQYTECMVDTNAQVFTQKAARTGNRYYGSYSESPGVKAFMDYVHKMTNMPVYNEKKYETYYAQYKVWDSLRLNITDSLSIHDKKFSQLLKEAVQCAVKAGGTDDEFEEYTELYYSQRAALEMKRNRIVVGGCSMDESPRIHAFNIAKLAAQTADWEIFLRSHLDIMNDRFERVSDGSYAYGRRKTYIKELEVLQFDVPDLLLGICLRVDNPGNNHYFGNIPRVGRALAESADRDAIEKQMLDMMQDESLDDYNRLLMYYLYRNYNYYLENKIRQADNNKLLKQAVQSFPGYIVSKISMRE